VKGIQSLHLAHFSLVDGSQMADIGERTPSTGGVSEAVQTVGVLSTLARVVWFQILECEGV